MATPKAISTIGPHFLKAHLTIHAITILEGISSSLSLIFCLNFISVFFYELSKYDIVFTEFYQNK